MYGEGHPHAEISLIHSYIMHNELLITSIECITFLAPYLMKQNYYSHFVDENIETKRSDLHGITLLTIAPVFEPTLVWFSLLFYESSPLIPPALPSFWPTILSLQGWISIMLLAPLRLKYIQVWITEMYEIFKLYQFKYDKNNWAQAGQFLMENIGRFIVFKYTVSNLLRLLGGWFLKAKNVYTDNLEHFTHFWDEKIETG